MNYSSKEIAIAAAVPDNLQFMQDIRRHHLPIHARKFNGANRYDLTSFAIAVTTGELREFGLSLTPIDHLLSPVAMDNLHGKSFKIQKAPFPNHFSIVSIQLIWLEPHP